MNGFGLSLHPDHAFTSVLYFLTIYRTRRDATGSRTVSVYESPTGSGTAPVSTESLYSITIETETGGYGIGSGPG